MKLRIFRSLKIVPVFGLVFLGGLSMLLLHCQASRPRVIIKSETARAAEQQALERGRQIYFDEDLGSNGLSCNSCHPKGMDTRAEAYPRYKHVLGTMATISMTHNFAVVNENRGNKWELGSEDANAIALYVKFLANGKKMTLSQPLKYQNDWIQKGETAFQNSNLGRNQKSCATCHTKNNNQSDTTFVNLEGIAAIYPRYRQPQNRVITLEQQILHCLTQRLTTEKLPLDHETIVSLVCYLASISQGYLVAVAE